MKKILLCLLAIVAGASAMAQIQIHVIPDTADTRFGLPIKEFDITVPLYYNNNTYINASMGDKCEARAIKMPPRGEWENLNNEHFSNPSFRLEPGKTYHVKMFPVISDEKITIEQCREFLRIRHVIFVGGPGLLLAYDLQRDNFPRHCWINSLDENDNLWTDFRQGSTKYPRVYIDTDFHQTTTFDLGVLTEPLPMDVCLLGFTEIEKKVIASNQK